MMSKLFLYSSIKNCQRLGEEVILSFTEGDEQRIYLRSLRKELRKYKTNVYFGGIGSGLSY